jgi:uncharacterized membrane protein YeaQ/YmgE (transglycosylase-associated protein family)
LSHRRGGTGPGATLQAAAQTHHIQRQGTTMPANHEETTVLGFILFLLIIGLIAGFIARLLVPGPDPMSILGTIALGIVGSFVGGFLGWLIFGKDFSEGALQPSGLIGSIVGAVIALLVYRALGGRGDRRTVA